MSIRFVIQPFPKQLAPLQARQFCSIHQQFFLSSLDQLLFLWFYLLWFQMLIWPQSPPYTFRNQGHMQIQLDYLSLLPYFLLIIFQLMPKLVLLMPSTSWKFLIRQLTFEMVLYPFSLDFQLRAYRQFISLMELMVPQLVPPNQIEFDYLHLETPQFLSFP